ncbi:AlbA family DNA-binding domain-containing protein [Nocardiopsis synnemataformans]|uniref:AlbA family DNA-binding domain-containing protein n=1 Tax=Nocardiopsis synnemataformans TaxID=61305 RepID=UPI003EBB6D53
MHDDELLALVEDLRRYGGDLADVEVKRAQDKLPKSTHETLSAFANTKGGVLILGLDEKSGFQAVGTVSTTWFRFPSPRWSCRWTWPWCAPIMWSLACPRWRGSG